jgi:hypothetical protein
MGYGRGGFGNDGGFGRGVIGEVIENIKRYTKKKMKKNVVVNFIMSQINKK